MKKDRKRHEKEGGVWVSEHSDTAFLAEVSDNIKILL